MHLECGSRKLLVIAAIVLATVYPRVRADSGVQILDADGDAPIESIAKELCSRAGDSLLDSAGFERQIARISTIKRLVLYLESLPEEHEFSACAGQHLAALKALEQVLSVSNHDSCSDAKISALETFHKNYMSSQSDSAVPQLIQVFFLHYASLISNACAEISYYFNHEKGVALLKVDESQMANLDQFLKKFSAALGGSSSSLKYTDMFSLWTLLDSLPEGVSSQYSAYLTEGETRVTVKLSSAEDLLGLRHTCINFIRPIYFNTLLPVMRLADLGYYPADSAFVDQINESPVLRRLYDLAALCEIVIRLRIIEDSALQADKVVFLEADEASKIPETPYSLETYDTEFVTPEPCSIETIDQVSTVNKSVAIEVAKKVKNDIESRKNFASRLIKITFNNIKSFLIRPKFELSRTHEDLEKKVNESLDKNTRPQTGAKLNSLVRGSRSPMAIVKGMVRNLSLLALAIFVGIAFVICLVLKVVFYTLALTAVAAVGSFLILIVQPMVLLGEMVNKSVKEIT